MLLQEDKVLVKDLCTDSIRKISVTVQGDHTGEQYSSRGIIYVLKASIKALLSPEVKDFFNKNSLCLALLIIAVI